MPKSPLPQPSNNMPTALILPIVQLVLQVLPYLPKLIEDLKQSGELTPEQDAKLDADIEAHKTDPAWQVND